ncbi:unnamed protein product [Paramecium sonneborni]|uniref:Uncharacterized protein n=1 Tax=Paramecium sonneborni TaxID=65129 RepID=A0A8S1QQE2_9CILI|nr:unnamed protein product [Paramecium sonneborni]
MDQHHKEIVLHFQNIAIDITLFLKDLSPKIVTVSLAYKEQAYLYINYPNISLKQKRMMKNGKKNFQAKFDFQKCQSYRIDVFLDNNTSIGSINGNYYRKDQNERNQILLNFNKIIIDLVRKYSIPKFAGINLLNTDGLLSRSDPFFKFYQWDEQWNEIHQTEFVDNNFIQLGYHFNRYGFNEFRR